MSSERRTKIGSGRPWSTAKIGDRNWVEWAKGYMIEDATDIPADRFELVARVGADAFAEGYTEGFKDGAEHEKAKHDPEHPLRLDGRMTSPERARILGRD